MTIFGVDRTRLGVWLLFLTASVLVGATAAMFMDRMAGTQYREASRRELLRTVELLLGR
jgi:hypothetical protein